MAKRRCQSQVTDKQTGKKRKCKKFVPEESINNEKKFCTIHQLKYTEEQSYSDTEYSSDYNFDVGECCFCGCECNPLSQSCGACPRNMIWRPRIFYESLKSNLKDDYTYMINGKST